jgi:excisionase family DNA binding protein
MTIAEQIDALVKTLPQDQAGEILTFAEYIRTKNLAENQVTDAVDAQAPWSELVSSLAGAWANNFPNLESENLSMSSAILTVEELAEYLKLPAATIQEQAEQGQLPGRNIGGHWRFRQAAIDDWLRGEDRPAKPLRAADAYASLGLRTSDADRLRLEQEENPWAKFIGLHDDDAEFAAIAAELRAEQDF